MRTRTQKRARLIAFACLLVGLLFLPKILVHSYANSARTQLTDSIWKTSSEQETVERFARWAAGYWQISDEKDNWNRLRLLPKPFKPNKEPISFLSGDGLCSEFVAAARWVLGDRFEVARHDVLFPNAGHSAISVRLSGGRWVFIDPFLGWIFKEDGRLLSLPELRSNLAAGKALKEFAVQLKEGASVTHYPMLLTSFDAIEGTNLKIRLTLPLTGKNHWSLGVIDGDWRDTQRAGIESRLTSHFFYVGRRFPANFNFHYQLPEDGRSYQMKFHLTEPPSAALPRFSIAPIISEKTLTFRFSPDQRELVVDSTGLNGQTWHAIDRFEVVADGQAS